MEGHWGWNLTQTKEIYRSGDSNIDFFLQRIAARLDALEGLSPDLSAGKYTLGSDKALSTETLGSIATQDGDAIAITGGMISGVTFVNSLLTFYDENEEIIHQFGTGSLLSQFATDPWSADMQEVSGMIDLVAGTANQITSTDDGDGSVTLSLPDPLILPGALTIPDGKNISLQEAISFTGATTENQIKFPDNLANALAFQEGANIYQQFVTTNGSEIIRFFKAVNFEGIVYGDVSVGGDLILAASENANSNSVIHFRPRPGVATDMYYDGSLNAMWDGNGDDYSLKINNKGYQSGVSCFRDLDIRDGKTNTIIFVDGSAGNFGIKTTSFGASMAGGMQIALATAPTGNVANTFAFFGVDQAAGNTCPGIRTENGAVLKLYQCLKADYNNWASHTDIVDALVAMGIFDAVGVDTPLVTISDGDEEEIHKFPIENIASYTKFV